MSFLRRHIFPLFGAAMTLAVGIGLGAGPLQGDGGDGASGDLGAGNAALQDQLEDVDASRQFGDAVAAGLAAGALEERLQGRSITLVVWPGVDDDDAQAMRAAVKAAGGSTAATVAVREDAVDAAKKTYVSSVAESSLDGAPDVAKSVGDDPYEQLGALVARAYVATGDSLAIDDEATRIDSELQGAGLVAVEGEPRQRGSAVVVLGLGGHGDDSSAQAAQLISSALVEQLAAAADGTVVVTPATGRADGGLLAALETGATQRKLALATLNISDGPVAPVAGVYALAAALRGKAAAFGTDGSAVILPPGLRAAPAG